MAVVHSAFGLILNSNLPIPGLAVYPPGATADIDIRLGTPPLLDGGPEKSLFFESSYFGESGDPLLRIWKAANGRLLHMAYYDGVQFWLDHRGLRIWSTWPETISLDEVATYLIGPVMGFALRLRGTTCLHASAIALKERAVAFVGPAGSGKSTTAATMAREGFSVVSDDIVSVTERGHILYIAPSFPFLSLWPESVDLLYGSPDYLPRFTADWEKRRLSVEQGQVQFQRQPLLLGTVYLFGERTGERDPHVEDIRPQTALLELVANTYATNLLDRAMRAKEFEVLGRLVAGVTLRRLLLPKGAGRPEKLCELIRHDCGAL